MATTTVNSGGVATQGSKTYLFGTSSGLDTSALVEAAYKQRTLEADKIDIRVTNNTTKHEAYAKLQSLGEAVRTSLATLRKTYGFSTQSAYTFDARSGSLTTDNTTDPSKLLAVGIDAGTALQNYEIEIQQKATANRIGSNNTFTDPAAALGLAGTFNLSLAGGATSLVTVTSGMTLNDLATAINATTTTSGVSASVLKVDSTHYQMILNGTSTAKAITIAPVSGTNVMQSIGVLSGGAAAHVLQAANQAQLTLDGVPITRDTNQIDDLITGVHLTIKSAEVGTKISLNVEHDVSTVKAAILSFTTAYNALRDEVLANQQSNSDGTAASTAVLFGDFLMRSMTTEIQGLFAGTYGQSGATTLKTLGNLGITLDATNKFAVDQSKLDDALVSHYDEVKSIFTTSITSSDSNFAVLSNKSKTKSITATLNVTLVSGTITQVQANGVNNLFDISGTSITGKAGTAYEGLTFAYVGTSSSIVNFTMNQGIADLVDNATYYYTDPLYGSFEREKQRLDDLNSDMTSRAAYIRQRADDYRNKLIDKYAKYESLINQSKSTLAQLQAILGTSSSSSG